MPRRARPDVVTQAVKLLGARERTEARLRAALATRGYAEPEIALAVARVKALGYLDDARVATARAREGVAQGRAAGDVVRRLVGEGVDEAQAEAAVRAAADEAGHDEAAAARRLLARRGVSGARAARLLAARGFSEEIIREVTGLTE